MYVCMQYANRSNWKFVDNCGFFLPVSLLFFAPFEAGIYPGITRTRDFCELCTTLPVSRTSVSSVYALATIPGSSGSFVRLSCPYPKLLEVL